jgi:hypothetical protein
MTNNENDHDEMLPLDYDLCGGLRHKMARVLETIFDDTPAPYVPRNETDEDIEREYRATRPRIKARNTNPTSTALAKITNGARSLYLSDKAPTQSASSSELYQSILEAVSYLARRNGNDLSGILTLANELTETDKD